MVSIQYFGDENSENLAILFPGSGYNLDMPLMWYSKALLGELGWQVWGVAYDHRQSGENLEQILEGEVNEVLASASGKFGRYLLMGKSLGTIAMQIAYQNPDLAQAKGVWLTPLMNHSGVRHSLLENRNGLIVYGTYDPAADLSLKSELEKRHQILEFPRAGHSLQVPNSEDSVAIMASYLRVCREFLTT